MAAEIIIYMDLYRVLQAHYNIYYCAGQSACIICLAASSTNNQRENSNACIRIWPTIYLGTLTLTLTLTLT